MCQRKPGWLTAAWCLLLLTACGGDPHQVALEDYRSRLGRALDTPVVAPAPTQTVRKPRSAALQQTVDSGNLGTLDFLALTGCEVQITIGKRNSSLGRLASASQRLLLDLEFLRLAPDCIAFKRTQGNATLADTLENAWQLKQQQLPALIYNATLAGPEFRALWAPPDSLSGYPGNTSSEVPAALTALREQAARWLAGDYRADNRGFEILLSDVARGDGGALLLALERQGSELSAASAMAAARRQSGPVCLRGRPSPQGRILDNVVRKFFIGAVQTQAAALNRRYHQLLEPIHALESDLDAAHAAAFRVWRDAREERLRTLLAAPAEHVASVQPLLQQCGLAPGQVSAD